MSPWTSYVARTIHRRAMFITSDNANRSPIPERDGIVGSLYTLKRDMGAHVYEGFKPPSLSKFYGCSDPYEHVASINTYMAIIEASDSLKCKLVSRTFMGISLQRYMGLPCASITIYQELVIKLVHQFIDGCHRKMSITSLFSIRLGPLDLLRYYLA